MFRLGKSIVTESLVVVRGRKGNWGVMAHKYVVSFEDDVNVPELDNVTRMIQSDEMGREVGQGFRMGNTCKSMADSYQCMAKTTTVL